MTGSSGERLPPPPPRNTTFSAAEQRQRQAGVVASMIYRNRQTLGDEHTLYLLLDWDQTPLPRFHRR